MDTINLQATIFAIVFVLLLSPFIMFAVLDEGDQVSEQVEIEVCDDCAMMSANGSHGWEYDESWYNAYVATADRIGDPVLICHEYSESCGWFSMSPCDFCGSSLGGNRHPAVIGLA